MHIAQRMVAGVDMWINLPRVPLEACGTSGMKAALNRVPHLSTLVTAGGPRIDGGKRLGDSPAPATRMPSSRTWRISSVSLEQEIVPTFYDRIPGKVRAAWVHIMKSAMAVSIERFTTRQMLQNYVTRFYVPAAAGEALPGDPPP